MAEDPIPAPPAHLPVALQKKWSSIHASALKQAVNDIPGNESVQRATARREANKMLRVPKPETHAEAAALVEAFQAKEDAGWQIIGHGKRIIGSVEHLSIVTADGQRHIYPVPTKGKKEKPATD